MYSKDAGGTYVELLLPERIGFVSLCCRLGMELDANLGVNVHTECFLGTTNTGSVGHGCEVGLDIRHLEVESNIPALA